MNCQNSKPWGHFRKAKKMFQTTTRNPSQQPKAKQQPTQKVPGNEVGWGRAACKEQGWVRPRTEGDELPKSLAEKTKTHSVPLPGPLVLLFLPTFTSLRTLEIVVFSRYSCICCVPLTTQNVCDVSPANHFSRSFNYLENLNILTVN